METPMAAPTRKASAVTLIDAEYPPPGPSISPNYRFPALPPDDVQSVDKPPQSALPSPTSSQSLASSLTLSQKISNFLRPDSYSSSPKTYPRKGSAATLTTDTPGSYNQSGTPKPSSIRPLTIDDKSVYQRAKGYSVAEIDANRINLICVYLCYITGFTNAISFSACYVWAGFQSANVANLGLALARTFNPMPYGTRGFLIGDQQLLISLCAFCAGTFLGRIGDNIGPTKRIWLVGATFFQALLATAGTLCAHFAGESGIALDRGDPSWSTPMGMAALALISASMGLQGIIGKRLASPMNTTVVLTTTWVELFNDPFLFAFKYAPSRDVRIAGILAIFFGAFCSRGLVATACGMTGSLGIMIGLRIIQMVWFAFMREPKSQIDDTEGAGNA